MEQVPKIVRDRLQATAKPEIHPDANLLTAFAEKSLNTREQAEILDHLPVCADCRKIVSLSLPEQESLKMAAAAPAVPASYAVRSQRPRWQMMSWVALTACVLVVGGVVIRNKYR